MGSVLVLLVVWFAVSVAAALVIGPFIALGSGAEVPMPDKPRRGATAGRDAVAQSETVPAAHA